MSASTPPIEPVVARQAQIRVWREGIGLVITSLVIGAAFVGPLIIVVASAIPQVAAALPAPARQVTLYMDGLPGDEEGITEGAGGDEAGESFDPDDAAMVDEVELDVPEVADATEDGTDEVTEVATAKQPEPAAQPEPEPVVTKPDVKPKEPQEPEQPDEPGEEADEGEASPGDDAPNTLDDRQAAKAKAKAEAAARRAKRRAECQAKHPDIELVNDHHWKVKRSLIDYYASSMERFNSLGYSRRYAEGDVKGWLVGGFGCKSPLYKGGLRSNDILQTVNGRRTNNVLQLFGIWAAQRNKPAFNIVVLRKGKYLMLNYSIVNG